VVIVDITERKRAEEQLRVSQERLALAASGTRLASISTEALWGFDRQCPWPRTPQKQAPSFQ